MGLFSRLSDILATGASGGLTSAVGIDIGASSIKVVEVQDREGVLTLGTYGEVQLGPYAGKPIGATPHLTPKQEQEALIDVLRESAVTATAGVFSIPLSSSFISTATLEASDEADLSALVRVEARKLIPASLSEVTLDWAELDLAPSDSYRTVLIAAIQNSAISRFNVLKKFAGFSDAPTEIECFSTARAVGASGNELVIDFGAASTKLYILNQTALHRMYRFTVGGAALTKRLASELSLGFEEAENSKLQTRSTADPQYQQLAALQAAQYTHPLQEFKQVVAAYQREHEVTFDRVLVCGGASLSPSMVPLVQDTFMHDVEYIDPFESVAYPAFMSDTMSIIGPSFVSSIGSSLRLFN